MEAEGYGLLGRMYTILVFGVWNDCSCMGRSEKTIDEGVRVIAYSDTVQRRYNNKGLDPMFTERLEVPQEE